MAQQKVPTLTPWESEKSLWEGRGIVQGKIMPVSKFYILRWSLVLLTPGRLVELSLMAGEMAGGMTAFEAAASHPRLLQASRNDTPALAHPSSR